MEHLEWLLVGHVTLVREESPPNDYSPEVKYPPREHGIIP